MGIGAIRNALFRTGVGDVVQMSRVLGVLYLSGGILVLISLILPHSDNAFDAGLWGIVGVGLVGGALLIGGARYASEWMIHAIVAAGTALICICEISAGVATGAYSAMFVWVVLMAASFFRRGAVAAHVAWIVVAWGLTLTVVDSGSGFPAVTRWVLGSIVIVIAALVVTEIVTGRRAGEEERERLRSELDHLAHHDPLTGVANRRLFETELPREMARARRLGTSLCVLALDLDRFKMYNDHNGHIAGDHLLKSTASGWSGELRAADLLARLGGDEFVAVLPDCTPEMAERVAERLAKSVPLGESCSTGIACWDGRESAESLIKRADKAMYAAKVEAARPLGVLKPPKP
jgi:diguanylate cyclase (GGDEF)-like protein